MICLVLTITKDVVNKSFPVVFSSILKTKKNEIMI
jgi:hypothetical protein